ncbi:MAG: hypothetical protein H6809_07570 [Phycisphaeraceae bacterium]|nr:hypothetical protein [Phycisphaeraceae bacterium]
MRPHQVQSRALLALTAAILTACGPGSITPTHAPPPPDSDAPRVETLRFPSPTETAPRDLSALPNVVAFRDAFYSGGAPEGDEAFAALAAIGVRTIISVDGATPDAEAARRHGIRTIHLPIGYNGFDDARQRQLARAARDAAAQGPVYIHCHHGKHRAAGAAATIAVNLGWLTPAQAIARMRVAGTSDAYPGLYACAGSAEPLDAGTLDSVPADFPEASMPTGIVAGMVEIDQIMEHLKAIEAAGWRTPTDHPDLVPAAEAARLADLFRVIGMSDEAAAYDAEFAARLTSDGALATTLESTLVGGRAGTGDLAAILSDQHARLAASCTDCHAAYRD